MRIWRIAREPHAALDGEGARLYGARWSSEGVPVVYASASLSLAALEYLVHIDIEDLPPDLVALAIDPGDDASQTELGPESLPRRWRDLPAPAECQAIGDEWVARNETLLLRVPSIVIPEESNLLVNPRHPEAVDVRVADTRRFAFDPRLLGGR